MIAAIGAIDMIDNAEVWKRIGWDKELNDSAGKISARYHYKIIYFFSPSSVKGAIENTSKQSEI